MSELVTEVNLPHESDQYTQRIPCAYCGKDNLFTRCFFNERVQFASAYLCYNCGIDFVDKNEGWRLVTTKVHFPTSQS